MANKNTYCNDPEEAACLDELIKLINDDLTIACQIPFTVPKKEINNIIQRAKKYFYKIYEDSVEQMYIALPAGALQVPAFKQAQHATMLTAVTGPTRTKIFHLILQ